MAFVEALKIELGKDSYCAKLAALDFGEGLYVVDLASPEPCVAVAVKDITSGYCSIWKYLIDDTSILNYVSMYHVFPIAGAAFTFLVSSVDGRGSGSV
jgi:hypothetical protein